MFPNLSDFEKSEGLKLQQENIQGFMQGLRFEGRSPLELLGMKHQLGHCAEMLPLL
jgi:hypothetical protein